VVVVEVRRSLNRERACQAWEEEEVVAVEAVVHPAVGQA
jgi:hypothetical protein